MKEYRTHDLNLAAYLHYLGFSFLAKDVHDGKYTVVFELSEEITKASIGYYNGATAEAKKLFDAYRTTKDFLWNNK